jgi:ADP-heptose:LPS heptosyltransferase
MGISPAADSENFLIPLSRSTSPRIVIPVVAGIGNALLAVPMVRALRRARPDARITILARIDAIAEVFKRLPEIEETIVTGKGTRGIWNMIRAARRRRPDLYLVPFPSNRWQYSMLALTSSARRRILHGYPIGYWRAMHFVGKRIPAIRGLHDVEQNLNLLRAVVSAGDSAEPDPKHPQNAPIFPLSEADRAAADQLLGAAGIGPGNRFIIIHAGSARTILARAKRWPPASYARLIQALQRETPEPVVLVEGPDEAGVVDEILHHLKSTVPAARPLAIKLTGPLAVAGAILERAALYVGSDSGLAHLAAAVGTPPVTLFAPADPDRVCPYGYRDLVVQAPSPCAPCFEYPWNATRPRMRCHDPMCITRITVEMVMDAVDRARSCRPVAGAHAPVRASADSTPAAPPAPAADTQPATPAPAQETGA